MADHTKAIISTYQVEIMEMNRSARNDGRAGKTGGHGILRAQSGRVGRAGDRPGPPASRPVLHGAVPGAARGGCAHLRARPVRLVADRRWAGGEPALVLVD